MTLPPPTVTPILTVPGVRLLPGQREGGGADYRWHGPRPLHPRYHVRERNKIIESSLLRTTVPWCSRRGRPGLRLGLCRLKPVQSEQRGITNLLYPEQKHRSCTYALVASAPRPHASSSWLCALLSALFVLAVGTLFDTADFGLDVVVPDTYPSPRRATGRSRWTTLTLRAPPSLR